MTLRKALGLLICGVTATVGGSGCTETPYIFFGEESAGPCQGDACGCEGGFCVSEAATNEETGTDVGPPQEPGERCESGRDSSITLERIELPASGRCIAQGPYTPLRGEPSYAIALLPCTESVTQMWAVGTLEDGSTEFRNEAVNLNLDVRFAASDDGTPIVLFTPHQLYNQRFTTRGGANASFKLSPLHAPGKCLTERDDALVLLPCQNGLATQNFSRIPCR